MTLENLMDELKRIGHEVHQNHLLLQFIAGRFQSDFSSEDASVRRMTQQAKDATMNVEEAKTRIPQQ